MTANLEDLVDIARKSVVEQLQSANMLFDVVRQLSTLSEDLPDLQKTLLQNEAMKIYEKATTLSDNAGKIGKDLFRVVTK